MLKLTTRKANSTRFLLITALLAVFVVSLSYPFLSDKLLRIDDRFLILPLITAAMILLLIHTRFTNKRLKDLQKLAGAIGRGEFNRRSNDKTEDSIGKLATSVNLMAQRIQESIDELEKSKGELEKSSKKLEKQNEELSLSVYRQQKFGKFLSGIHQIDINKLADVSLDYLMSITEAKIGIFYYRDGQKKHLLPISGRSIDQGALAGISKSPVVSGVPQEVIARRDWVVVENLLGEEETPELDFGAFKIKIRHVYGIPITFGENILGVIILGSLRRVEQSTRDYSMNYVGALANSLANAMTYRSVQKQSVHLEEVNQELMEAQEAKSQFLANMSHELRTPLNSIIGFSTILQKNRDGSLGDDALKRIDKINRNGRHLLNLINDVLDLSKVEAGKMELLVENSDLCVIAQDVYELLSPQAEAKGLELRFKSAEKSMFYPTDESKLKQVIINLVGNAIKFTRKGHVKIHIHRVPLGGLCIDIEDTGMGIRKEHMNHIFDAFSQADSSTSREFGGTGLGLSISRTFVESLGGKLEVFSEYGKGSTFRIHLKQELKPKVGESTIQMGTKTNATEETSPVGDPTPVPDSDKMQEIPREEPVPESSPHSESNDQGVEEIHTLEANEGTHETIQALFKKVLPPIAGKKVLIVDDDDNAQQILGDYLEEAGAACRKCSNPVRIRDHINEFQPDLITLDIIMPQRNGWEVLKELKADPGTSAIPVIVISMVAEAGTALTFGAVDALSKPIIQDDFIRTIQRNLYCDEIKNKKILVVDDFEEFHEIIRSWIDESENELVTVVNGLEALKKLESFTPDIVFLDLIMPKMDGFTFLGHFRANDAWAQIPVVVITGKTLNSNETEFLKNRASLILSKEEIGNPDSASVEEPHC